MRRFTLRLGVAAVVLGLLAGPALASISYPPNDKYFADQWNLKTIKAPQAWTQSTGAGVVVAVVDSGVNFVADLAGQSAGSYNCIATGTNCVPSSGDDYGHGTSVASVLAAVANNATGIAGVAPDAKIMSIQVVGTDGTAKANDIANGVEFAADHGAKVINMSLGGDGSAGTGTTFDCPYPPCLQTFQTTLRQALQPAVDYAASKGSLVVVAAGNQGPGVSDFMGMTNVLIVGATGPQDEVASYSNTGSGSTFIYAPGGNNCSGLSNCIVMQTSGGDFVMNEGTSFATPEVAGVAALLVAQGSSASAAASRIVGTGDHISAGLRLDAAAALGASASLPGPTTQATIVPTVNNAPGTPTNPAAPSGGSSAAGSSAPRQSKAGTGANPAGNSAAVSAQASPQPSPSAGVSPDAQQQAAPNVPGGAQAAAAIAKPPQQPVEASAARPVNAFSPVTAVLALLMFVAAAGAAGMVWVGRNLHA